MPKRYSTKDITKMLGARGFWDVSQRGSHMKFTNGSAVVIVPAGRTEIRLGTLSSILKQAGLTKADL